jgi:hypothetical protein
MNPDIDRKGNLLLPRRYRQGWEEGGASDLSLSKQTELASSALVVGRLVMLMNDVLNERASLEGTSPSLIDSAIRLTEQLEQGDAYLSRCGVQLMMEPESADMVRHIQAHGELNVTKRSREAAAVFDAIKRSLGSGDPKRLAEVDPEKVRSARAFFRVVHTAILDRLGASEIAL